MGHPVSLNKKNVMAYILLITIGATEEMPLEYVGQVILIIDVLREAAKKVFLMECH